MIERYGRQFETNSALDVELWAFKNRLTVEQGGMGPEIHMQNLIREIWPDYVWEDEFGSLERPQEQCWALCNHDVVGFTSGASEGKSDILGKWALLNYFCDPVNTLVLVVSTSAKDAAARIWGNIVKDFRFARKNHKAVGKLIESMSLIRLTEGTDGMAASDNSVICLVAGGSEFANDALKKMEGKHNKRVLVILDELQDVSESIVKEAVWNLSAAPYFHISAAGNASDRNDAHGQFLLPLEGGWTTINQTTHTWKIKVGNKEGIGIHFDGENSPNMKRYLAGRKQVPFWRQAEDYLAAKTLLGDESPQFLRQFRGFWSSKGDDANFIVTDAALASHHAYDRRGDFSWQSKPIGALGFDPSYSDGGDRWMISFVEWGLCTDGVWRLYFNEHIHLQPKPVPGETRDFAAIRECKQIAIEKDVAPRMIGMDASAGTPLLSIAHQQWSHDILAVPFGGSATDLPISMYDKRLASEVYSNRTSELAYVFVEFLNSDQIRGVKPDHAKELTNRKYEIVSGKIRIEKKSDAKKRLGCSPDLSDSGAVALAVIRERLKVQAGATGGTPAQAGDWRALARRCDVVSRTAQVRRFSLASGL